MRSIIGITLGIAALMTTVTAPALAGSVMDEIKSTGSIVCMVNTNSPGFSTPDSKGVFQGFNTDFCNTAGGRDICFACLVTGLVNSNDIATNSINGL